MRLLGRQNAMDKMPLGLSEAWARCLGALGLWAEIILPLFSGNLIIFWNCFFLTFHCLRFMQYGLAIKFF